MSKVETFPWVETASGVPFRVDIPRSTDIKLEDVAHVLPRLCRYNGHSQRWYSVAEHCCLMADWVMDNGGGPLNALTALHHDDAEFIMGDLVRPIKDYMPAFKAYEEKMDMAVAERFGTIYPFPSWLKEADSRILLDERDNVMRESMKMWGLDYLEPLGVQPWNFMGRFQWYVRKQWLQRHHHYTGMIAVQNESVVPFYLRADGSNKYFGAEVGIGAMV